MHRLDPSNLLGSIERLPYQLTDAWNAARAVRIPAHTRGADRVVVCGMGGSTLGAHLMQSVYRLEWKVPLEICNEYQLPAHVDRKTLVILSSYSGNTEETLSCADDALRRKARVMAMTAGGKLLQMAEDHGWPTYVIDPQENPSNQPRMAIGYMSVGLLALLKNTGLVRASERDIKSARAHLIRQASLLAKHSGNSAQLLAKHAQNKLLLLVSAEHLVGAAHVVNNQMNENAKHVCQMQVLPELNHHFLEGLSFPRAKRNVHAVLLQSSLYHARLQKRVRLTKALFRKNGISTEILNIAGKTPFDQAFAAVQIGSYASYLLAMRHGIDPSPVPNVEAFKRAMG